MNTYKKYCPNVYVAKTETEHKKGDTIIIKTRYGKENEHIIHNFIGYTGTKENPMYCYSITRADGFNSQERAKQKAEKLNGYANNANKRSDDLWKQSNEGREFLSLGEPIKIGHHSESRHRNLIERNRNRMDKSVAEQKKADQYNNRAEYWENKKDVINLSMPESIEFYKFELEKATKRHKGLKDGTIKRAHDYTLTYAKNKCNEMKKKYETAKILWGN